MPCVIEYHVKAAPVAGGVEGLVVEDFLNTERQGLFKRIRPPYPDCP